MKDSIMESVAKDGFQAPLGDRGRGFRINVARSGTAVWVQGEKRSVESVHRARSGIAHLGWGRCRGELRREEG